ncbi:unnamed protein product, partial [Hymenolepis diminuta]
IIAQELFKKSGLKTSILANSVDNSRTSDSKLVRQSIDSRASIAKVVDFNASDVLRTTDEKNSPTRNSVREYSRTRKNTSRPTSTASSATLSICSIH